MKVETDRGTDEWNEDNSEECGKLGIPMFQAVATKGKASLRTSHVNVMLKRQLCISWKFVIAKYLDGYNMTNP